MFKFLAVVMKEIICSLVQIRKVKDVDNAFGQLEYSSLVDILTKFNDKNFILSHNWRKRY